MQQKKLIQNFRNLLPVFLLGVFSFLINYYYGFIGFHPMDNTVLYNGGYRVLNGYTPFNDYWLVTGPLLDYLNAFFFYISGINWKTFIIHSSIVNLILAISSYYVFNDLGIKKHFSLFYSALISLLFYPVVGTPFVDHHSTFFLLIGFYLFILGVNRKKFYYFSFIPTIFSLAFLSKQTPAAYGVIGIIFLTLILCFFNKKEFKKIMIYFLIGSLVSVVFLFLFFWFTGIDTLNFYNQYILFAGSVGNYRMVNYTFDIFGILMEYKFIFFFIIILTIFLVNLILKNSKNKNQIVILFSSIILAIILIIHQFYTLNQNYIFFLIPLLCAVLHSTYERTSIKNYILLASLLICIYSVTKYHLRFNEHRKFNELEKVDLSKAINAEVFSKDLKNLKWITILYPNDPKKEITNLKKAMDILANDTSNKAIITSYQFLAPTLGIYDFSPNQWHHPSVSFPTSEHKYFNTYKLFFINNLKKNNIKFIYETKEKDKTTTELILNKNCIKKQRMSYTLIRLELIQTCLDLQ